MFRRDATEEQLTDPMYILVQVYSHVSDGKYDATRGTLLALMKPIEHLIKAEIKAQKEYDDQPIKRLRAPTQTAEPDKGPAPTPG